MSAACRWRRASLAQAYAFPSPCRPTRVPCRTARCLLRDAAAARPQVPQGQRHLGQIKPDLYPALTLRVPARSRRSHGLCGPTGSTAGERRAAGGCSGNVAVRKFRKVWLRVIVQMSERTGAGARKRPLLVPRDAPALPRLPVRSRRSHRCLSRIRTDPRYRLEPAYSHSRHHLGVRGGARHQTDDEAWQTRYRLAAADDR
jgi:hypothetical protein